MPLTIGAVGIELRKDFLDDWSLPDGTPLKVDGQTIVTESFLNAFSVIGSLLTDVAEVKEGLKRLETQMLSLIPPSREYSPQPYARKGRYEQAQDLIKYYKSKRTTQKPANLGSLLTRALEATEKVNGLTGVPATLTANIKADVFLSQLLLQRRPFKDPGAGPEHGESTHRIQWFIIATSPFFRKNCGYSPGEIYERIGRWYFPQAVNIHSNKVSTLSMWDALCDRFGPPVNEFPDLGEEDFRNPNKFHPWMLNKAGGENEFPILHAYLHARRLKRSEKGDIRDYLALKVYGKTYKALYDEYLTTRDMSKLIDISQNTTDSDSPRVFVFAPSEEVLTVVDFSNTSGVTTRDRFSNPQKYRP